MGLRDRTDQLAAIAKERLRRAWLRTVLRDADGNDPYQRLDRAYRWEDPWGMGTPREQHRFAECNRVLAEHLIPALPASARRPGTLTKVGSILEIGCGEGHQSEHLARLCEQVTGVEVSPVALARARKRVPTGVFHTGDLFDQPWVDEAARFDIVAAFEVLCHVRDIPRTIETMNRLGRGCVASWFYKDEASVAPHVRAMPVLGEHEIVHGDYRWTVAWWLSPTHPR